MDTPRPLAAHTMINQYHCCWCPGSLRRQATSIHGIDYDYDILLQVREGNFAFIMENTTASYYTHKEPCELTTVGGNLDGTLNHHAFVVRKNDPLKAQINGAITELRNSGELKQLQDKWWKSSECNAAAATVGTSVVMLSVSILAKILF